MPSINFLLALLPLHKLAMSEDTDSVYYCSADLIAKRGLIVLNKRPCRVHEIQEVDGKIKILASDILIQDKEYDATFSPDDEVGVPVVDRKNLQVCNLMLIKKIGLKKGTYIFLKGNQK